MGKAFSEVIRLKNNGFSPEEFRNKHIQIAKLGLAKKLSGFENQPIVSLYTDGRSSSNEESVIPGGIIEYRFSHIRTVVNDALLHAFNISPYDTGRYRSSWFPIVAGNEIEVDAIPKNVDVVIANDQPYHRKIEFGAKGFEKYVPPGIIEKIIIYMRSKYSSTYSFSLVWVTLHADENARSKKKVDNYPSMLISPKFSS